MKGEKKYPSIPFRTCLCVSHGQDKSACEYISLAVRVDDFESVNAADISERQHCSSGTYLSQQPLGADSINLSAYKHTFQHTD